MTKLLMGFPEIQVFDTTTPYKPRRRGRKRKRPKLPLGIVKRYSQKNFQPDRTKLKGGWPCHNVFLHQKTQFLEKRKILFNYVFFELFILKVGFLNILGVVFHGESNDDIERHIECSRAPSFANSSTHPLRAHMIDASSDREKYFIFFMWSKTKRFHAS